VNDRYIYTVVWDGSAKILYFYINGVLSASETKSSLNSFTYTNCFVGKNQGTGLRLKAFLKDFKVYGSALT
jgi:hypothetical protein